MTQAKIGFALGSISFSGEGDEVWVAAQLDKILEKAPSLAALSEETIEPSGAAVKKASQAHKGSAGTLASFLTAAGATANQNRRFLATAEWLHRKGSNHVKTSQVSKALVENHQKRLGNPADCLNQNVSRGFCEKVGKEFYVTDEGRTSLNIAS